MGRGKSGSLSTPGRGRMVAVSSMVGLWLLAAACGVGTNDQTSTATTQGRSLVGAEDHVSYGPSNGGCFENGPPAAMLTVDLGNQSGWVDLGIDGSVDVLRQGDTVYYRSAQFPSLHAGQPWISVPTDTKDPLNRFASSLELGTPAFSLLTQVVDPFAQVQSLQDDRHQSSPTAWDTNPGSPWVSWVDDGGGVVQSMRLTPASSSDGDPLHYTSVDVVRSHSDSASPTRPDPAEVVSLGDLPASAAVMAAPSWNPACHTNPDFAKHLKDLAQCVENQTANKTLSQWLAVPPADRWPCE